MLAVTVLFFGRHNDWNRIKIDHSCTSPSCFCVFLAALFSLIATEEMSGTPHKSLPVLRQEAEEAVRSLKAGKSPEVDIISSELLKNGGKATTTVLTVICKV